MKSGFLEQVALRYAPVIDVHRAVIATRLTVWPLTPDARHGASALLDAVTQVWPGGSSGSVQLDVRSKSMLRALLALQLPHNVALELPTFVAAEADAAPRLHALYEANRTLVAKALDDIPLAAELRHCFRYELVPELSAGTAAAVGDPGQMLAGVTSTAAMDDAFARGASAVTGWPLSMPPAHRDPPKVGNNATVVLELIQRVDQNEPIDALERTLYRDPALAYKLIRYINSAAFGLALEISSFRHAIMMLGYKNLKRWLAMLLASSLDDTRLGAPAFAAIRRGLTMERLGRASGVADSADELFICGVFSLLDAMFGQPLRKLLSTILVPDEVFAALIDDTGPYQPYLHLVRTLESGSLEQIRNAPTTLLMAVGEVNGALLDALKTSAKLGM